MKENPKEPAGRQKAPLDLLPFAFLVDVSLALAHGADKYGRWNWRDKATGKIHTMTYVAAMRRHIGAYVDGETYDPESGVHHLAHVAACYAILADAAAMDHLVDNRPPPLPIYVEAIVNTCE